MGIALTDDHRELGEVARGFLTSQKARAAARSLLDAPEEARPGFWPGSPNWAGSVCTSTKSMADRATDCPNWWS